jgi:hypothetical protein
VHFSRTMRGPSMLFDIEFNILQNESNQSFASGLIPMFCFFG